MIEEIDVKVKKKEEEEKEKEKNMVVSGDDNEKEKDKMQDIAERLQVKNCPERTTVVDKVAAAFAKNGGRDRVVEEYTEAIKADKELREEVEKLIENSESFKRMCNGISDITTRRGNIDDLKKEIG